jgi:hypothetical protein
MDRQVERAMVTYQSPHGLDAITLHDGDVASFGRGSECQVRFAFAPQPDEGVPRLAGRLLVMSERVFIESLGQVGHRALEVRTGVGSSVQIPIGEGFSPKENKFDVLVRGHSNTWKLGITVRPSVNSSSVLGQSDPPTRRYELPLSDFQFAVLRAYYEPIANGRIEPATHKDVAAALNYHPNTVREALYEIWALMFEQGVPMPDVTDKRIAVVEAARIHGLLSIQE